MSSQKQNGGMTFLIAVIATVLSISAAKSCMLKSPKAAKSLKSLQLLEVNRALLNNGKYIEVYEESAARPLSRMISNMNDAKTVTEAAGEFEEDEKDNKR